MPPKAKTKEPDTEYAVRCFVDGRRIKTCDLTQKQAKIFHQTALHLVNYLKMNTRSELWETKQH